MIDREEIAKRHGLPPDAAERLVGETAEELEADAAAVGTESAGAQDRADPRGVSRRPAQ